METPQIDVPMQFSEATAFSHRQLGRRASAAMRTKARAGGWIGYAPTGYRNVEVGKEKCVEIDRVLGPLVHEAFLLVARRHSSLQQVVTELVPRGLVSRNGKPLGASALSHIIRNPF